MTLLAAAAAHSSAVSGTLILVVVGFLVGIVVGANIGRRRALKHLGQAEFAARWKTILGISRW